MDKNLAVFALPVSLREVRFHVRFPHPFQSLLVQA